jgi:RNA-splicing ligase RtcB
MDACRPLLMLAQVVDEIYDPVAAEKMGVHRVGQVR